MKLKVTVNGNEYDIDVDVAEDEHVALTPIVIGGGAMAAPTKTTASVQATSANAVVAPLAGSVARVLVKEGDKITAGQVLLVLEAMKMETEIAAPLAGSVAAVHVAAGATVALGDPLVDVTPAETPGPRAGGDAPDEALG